MKVIKNIVPVLKYTNLFQMVKRSSNKIIQRIPAKIFRSALHINISSLNFLQKFNIFEINNSKSSNKFRWVYVSHAKINLLEFYKKIAWDLSERVESIVSLAIRLD